MELEALKNEVMRKIGRNMLLFQQMEYMLKFLVVNGNFAGSIGDIKTEHEKRSAAVKRRSFGQLVELLPERSHAAPKSDAHDDSVRKEIQLSLRLNAKGIDYYEGAKQTLTAFIDDRNYLIHHLLPDLDTSSVDSWMATDRFLDQQREKLLPEIATLEGIIALIERGRKEFAELLSSDETRSQMKSLLKHSRLVILLTEIAAQAARPDGWTMLNIAGQLLRQHAPDVTATLKGDEGHRTLKRLILATELFDIAEEPTEKGVRVLFRMKEGWTLQDS